MKRILIITFYLTSSIVCIGQNKAFDYFGIPGPGSKIELFAPGIVSLKDSKEKALAISPFGDEIFYSAGPAWPKCKIMRVVKINNQWSAPEVADFCSDCYATEPSFSPDGKYLYYSSSKGMKDINQYSIWRIEKAGNKWINAKAVIDNADPAIWEFHPSVSKDGSVYFCCWDSQKQAGSIYRSKYSGGNYSRPEKVNLSFDVKSSVTDPFINPSEKYIITAATGQNGKGGYDVFISYKKSDGSWLPPVNFYRFNTSGDEDSFDISPDGKFIFLYKQDNVYWTETNGVSEIK